MAQDRGTSTGARLCAALEDVLDRIAAAARGGDWEALPNLGREALDIAARLRSADTELDDGARARQRSAIERMLKEIGSITREIEPEHARLADEISKGVIRKKVRNAYGP